MLERVALGQTRFSCPGVAVDARGVALGRLGVMLFPALDGVVGWLRVYSDEGSLDDLMTEMRILRVRTALRSRAFLVFIPSASSYVMDKAARCARLVGGTCFTGSSKHFVKYRDDRSPYGYDVADLTPPPQGADVLLHGEDSSQPYGVDGQLELRALVFRLSLRRVPGSERLDPEARAELYLSAAPGLGSGVIRYLWRNRVQASVALVHSRETAPGQAASAFAGASGPYLLLRVRDVPQRIVDNFRGIPGIALYRRVTDNVIVEVGWAHPIELSSCASLFERECFHVFRGPQDGADSAVDVVRGPVEFSDSQHLTELQVTIEGPREQPRAAGPPASVGIDLKLVPTLSPPRRIVGTLVDWAEAGRLKQLVYMLPPAMLRGHAVGITERGMLLVAQAGVDVVPLGTLLAELAPGLLIPVGMDLVPRVAPDVLAQALGHATGRLTVFPHGGNPFYVMESTLQPLERRALATLEVAGEEREPPAPLPTAGEAQIVNEPVGAFALWGFPKP
jgi:hypothetical protein